MIGHTIAHYQILEKLGEGGMGVVYKARDTHLDRFVAIKVLPPERVTDPERKRRFTQEAKAASALNHPNIIHIYDIDTAAGVDFIAMEYVAGKTLAEAIPRKGMRFGEALKMAVQVADALARAHAAGIVHRDLKPSNIMVDEHGLVKVLDFGLAKLTEVPEKPEEAPTRTAEGAIVGTVAYMSPEQAEGKPVDARSDIFSFGSLLYEMVTGERAFRGDSNLSTLAAIIKQDPPPLPASTPHDLERLILRCLRKDPSRRFQHMDDVKIALEELKEESESGCGASAAPPRRRFPVAPVVAAAVVLLVAASLVWWFVVRRGGPIDSLAVLPFVNASSDPNTEYLSEGISESLITGLSRVARLKVKSWDTVFRYKGQDKDIQVVGRELGVRAVLKGRLVQHGDSLSISAELVDASDGTLLWRDQYKRRVAEVLSIEREISKEISAQLRLKLTGEEQRRLVTSSTRDPEAHQSYLRGRYHWNRRTEEALKKSVEYFQQSIEKDPGYAQAWAGLADAFLLLMFYGSIPPGEAFPRARAAANRAIELEEALAEAHVPLGYVKMLYEWDWPGAEREFQRAIELKPQYGTAHHWYADYLTAVGRLPEALAERRRAREVEPLSPIINAEVGRVYYYSRRYADAAEEFQKAVEMDPTFHISHLNLGLAYALQRRPREAAAELRHAIGLSQRGPYDVALAGAGFAVLGHREEAQKLLGELLELSRKRYVASLLPAMIYASLGEKERAFEYFEKALKERSLLGEYLRDPLLDGIRSDPRFQSILRRMGLPP